MKKLLAVLLLTWVAATALGQTNSQSLPALTVTGNLNLGSSGIVTNQYANASAGTATGSLVKIIDTAGTAQVTKTAVSDTNNAFGCVQSGAGTSGKALVGYIGIQNCLFDNVATTDGDFVIVSTAVAGTVSDAGVVIPTGVLNLGKVLSSHVACGSPPCGPYAVQLMTPDALGAAGTGIVATPSATQTIQPSTDATGLIIKQRNGTNTADTFSVQDKSANKLLAFNATNFPVFRGPSPWIDVISYGADPTGVSSSTAAINSAIAACPANGGTVFFPPGTYLISTQITFNAACTLKGFGRTAKLKRGAAAFTMILISHSDVGMEDLEIDGNNGSFTGSKNISVNSAGIARIRFDNLYIHNVDQGAIYATAASNISITNSLIVSGANGDPVFMEADVFYVNVSDSTIDASAETINSPHTIAFHSTTAGKQVAHVTLNNLLLIAPTPTTPGNGGFCIETGTFGVGALPSADFAISNIVCNLTAPVSGCYSFSDLFQSTVTNITCNSNGFLMSNTGLEVIFDYGSTFSNASINTDNAAGGSSCVSMNATNENLLSNIKCNGISSTGGIGFYLGTGSYGTFAISGITESGTTATVTTTGAVDGSVRIGHLVRLSGVTPTGYNHDWLITGQADSTHFTFTAPSGLGTASVPGNVTIITTKNTIEACEVKLTNRNLPLSGTLYGLIIQPNGTGDAVSNNTVKGCQFIGTGLSGQVGVNVSGANTADSNLFEGNQFIDLATGITRNNGTNTRFLNNTFTGTTTDYGGTAQTGEVIQGSGTFAKLPASAGNGSSWNCTDCTSTCAAGSSSGQICTRIAGAWTH